MIRKLVHIFLVVAIVGILVVEVAEAEEKNITKTAARKPEGTVTIGVQSLEAQVWLAHLGATSPMLQMFTGVYESLVQDGPNTAEIRPMLAEKWTVSADGKTYDFYLRKGVQFHDGWGEFTGDDVKFSIEQIMVKASRALRAGQYRELIAKIDIVDRYHVRIVLNKPCAEFPWMMSSWFQDTPIICKKYIEAVGNEKAGAHPIGTGPHKFVEQKIGEYVKLEAMESHWRVVPYYKYTIIRVVPETRTALAMVQRGQVDLTFFPLTMLKEAKAAGVKILTMPESGQVSIHLGGMYLPEIAKEKYDPACPWVPFNDKRAQKVRLALDMAIDKETIRKRVLSGYGKHQAQTGFVNHPSIDPAWKPIPYDPKGARALLADAGYPKGFNKPIIMCLFILPGSEQIMAVGEAVAQYWEKSLGLKVERRVIDYGPMRATWRERADAWMCWIQQWQGAFREPYMIATRMGLITTSISNFGMDQRVDDLCDKIMAEQDYNKRVILNRQFGQIWYDGRAAIPIGLIDTLLAATNKVGHWDRQPGMARIHNLEYLRP